MIQINLLLNNDGYGTMRRIHEGKFNTITQWNYRKICELVGGGDAVAVSTKGELDETIGWAQDSGELAVIEVKIPRHDISPQLARIGFEVARRRGWEDTSLPGEVPGCALGGLSRRQLELVVNPGLIAAQGRPRWHENHCAFLRIFSIGLAGFAVFSKIQMTSRNESANSP